MSWRGLPQLLEQREQPAEVGVVERRLDLVHDVERAGPGLEDRHQQRDRGERPLAAGEQREPLDLLARRAGLDLDARSSSMSPGSVRTSRPSPPGNSRAKTPSNSRAVSSYAAVKTCSTRSSTSRMMSSRSRRVVLRSSSCSVRNWCRSSSAANSSSASGLTRPSSGERPLGRRAAASPARRGRTARARGSGASGVDRRRRGAAGDGGTSWSRAVLREQRLGVDAELLERLGLERLDPQPLLGAGDLVAVHGVGEPLQLGAELAASAAERPSSLGVAPSARRLGRGPLLGRRARASARAGRAPHAAPGAHGPRPRGLAGRRARGAAAAPRARPLGRRAARSSGSARPASARTRSSPVRTASRASTSAWRAARRLAGERARGRRRSARRRRARPAARGEPLAQLGAGAARRPRGAPRRAASAAASRSASPLAARAVRAELAELLGDGGHPRVGLVQPAEGGLATLGGGPAPLVGARSSSNRPRSARCVGRRRAARSASSTAACTSSRSGARGRAAARAACRPSTSPVAGDGGQVRALADHGAGRGAGRRRRRRRRAAR